VPPVERINAVDLAIDVLIVVSQYLILRCLYADAKPRLPRAVFRAILIVFAVICAVTAAGIVLNIVRLHPEWNIRIPAVSGAWVSATEILWGFTSAISVAVYVAGRALLRRLPTPHSSARRRMIKAAAGAAMASPAVAMAFGGIIERTNFQVREVDLPVAGLHPDFEGFAIAQLSDLHVSPYLSVRQAARAVDMANELKPRLTLVTGDLISEHGDPLDATIAEIARLRADLGVIGCLGNHEVYAQCEDYTDAQARRRGIDFLRHSSKRIRWGQGELNFAGVDYQPFRIRRHYLAGADKLIVTGVPNILLSHNPDVFPVAVKQGYQAVVSGHTHGGQVTVEILRQTFNVVRFATPFVAGLYRMDGASCYVTAGIGTIGMPVRLGAPPEITLLRLRRA
jgi:predicted MPP superfamily phosphohydrolase